MQRIRKRTRMRVARTALQAMAMIAPVERPAPMVGPRGGGAVQRQGVE